MPTFDAKQIVQQALVAAAVLLLAVKTDMVAAGSKLPSFFRP